MISIFIIYLIITYCLGSYLISLSYEQNQELGGYDWFILALSPIFVPIIIIIALDSYFRERNDDL